MSLETWERQLLEHADRRLAGAVRKAVRMLLRHDSALLVADASERSIAHRLACHLGDSFPGWHVDCEYNRDGHNPKRLQSLPALPPGRDERAVYPDIIVHHRGTSDNYLVIELKKTSNPETDEYDLAKLRAFRLDLGYREALFMRVATGESIGVATVRWCAG